MKKITIIALFAFFNSLSGNAQIIASESFENTDSYDIPTGWFTNGFFFYDSYVDEYYGGCGDDKYISTNLYDIDTSLFLTTPTYSNLSANAKEITFELRIFDFEGEAPVTYNFGSINFSYSLNDGSTWTTLGTINNTNFTPQENCQQISYIIPASLITALTDLKFKWESSYSGVGDYEILIDNFVLSEEEVASNNELDKSKLKVYPNPVSESLNIDYSSPISKFVIFDLLGRQMGEYLNLNNSNTIDVSNLASGTYFLKIQAENNSESTIKFIKK